MLASTQPQLIRAGSGERLGTDLPAARPATADDLRRAPPLPRLSSARCRPSFKSAFSHALTFTSYGRPEYLLCRMVHACALTGISAAGMSQIIGFDASGAVSSS
jgi:hypothetical protein